MFGFEVSAVERCLFALPLLLGGLEISDPVSLASHLFTSVCGTEHLVRSIVGFETFEMDSHFDHVLCNKQFHCQQLDATFDEEFDQLLTLLDPIQQRGILRAKDSNIFSWLSVLPLSRSQFDFSAQEFRDYFALRYNKPLLSLPFVCDGYGAPFSTEHALDCCFRGLVACRHNEFGDDFGDLASLVWTPVVKESVMHNGSAGADTSITDLCVLGSGSHQYQLLYCQTMPA